MTFFSYTGEGVIFAESFLNSYGIEGSICRTFNGMQMSSLRKFNEASDVAPLSL